MVNLLVTLSISAIAISLGGLGLTGVTSYEQASFTRSEAQQDALQALDFIASEARQAQSFEIDPVQIDALNQPNSPFATQVNHLPGIKSPVVILNIEGLLEPVVYFLAPATRPWQGQALYRWGPAFNDYGEYQLSSFSTPNQWSPTLLVDQISQRSLSPNCHSWTPMPQTGIEGFYACIGDEGQIAEFVFQREKVNAELRTKVFARSN